MFRLLNYTTKNLNKRLLNSNITLTSKSFNARLFKVQNKNFFGFNAPPNSNPNNKKYYEILEVDRNASQDEIKKSFRKKAMQYHPDKGGDPEKFKEISRAYEVLSNQELRSQYDRFGEEGVQGNGEGDPMKDAEDIFANMFGGFGGFGSKKQQQPKAQQKEMELVVTLEDVYTGATKNVEFKRNKICKTCKAQGTTKPEAIKKCMGCQGTGMKTITQNTPMGVMMTQTICNDCKGEGNYIKEGDRCGTCRGKKITLESKKVQVDIPKGVKDGHFFVFTGEGDEIPKAKTGDYVVIIKIAKHKFFIRKGADLYYNLRINLLEALTGFETVIPHLNGEIIMIKSNPGEIIKPGSTKSVKEMGMPFFENSYKHGNLNIVFDVEFPSKLDINDKEAYERLLKTQSKRKINKDNVSNSYYISDFNQKDANTSERGGKAARNEEEDGDDMRSGGQKVQCNNQ